MATRQQIQTQLKMQIHTHSENKYKHKVQDLVADRKVRNKNGNMATQQQIQTPLQMKIYTNPNQQIQALLCGWYVARSETRIHGKMTTNSNAIQVQ